MADDNKYSLLSKIEYPDDLRKLKIDELPQVCEELRSDIIDEVSMNPGHFASSLGVVEITVALHYVFNTPEDRLVWDVGHQAYGHKILTGRRESFCTNRKLHGIRPFPSPLESQYDTFACGHASNSISAALGMAVAAKVEGKNRHVVAIIGDGAMSGGLAFEGLNNVSSTDNDLLIILNDNDMSIDRAVGGMEKCVRSPEQHWPAHHVLAPKFPYHPQLHQLPYGVFAPHAAHGLNIRLRHRLAVCYYRKRFKHGLGKGFRLHGLHQFFNIARIFLVGHKLHSLRRYKKLYTALFPLIKLVHAAYYVFHLYVRYTYRPLQFYYRHRIARNEQYALYRAHALIVFQCVLSPSVFAYSSMYSASASSSFRLYAVIVILP